VLIPGSMPAPAIPTVRDRRSSWLGFVLLPHLSRLLQKYQHHAGSNGPSLQPSPPKHAPLPPRGQEATQPILSRRYYGLPEDKVGVQQHWFWASWTL
jgi:hypothetical protein